MLDILQQHSSKIVTYAKLSAVVVTRSSATVEKQRVSCAHIGYLGWLADMLMITHSCLVVQCTVYGKVAEVVLFFDIQTL